MKITVQYFAALAEYAAKTEEEIELEDPSIELLYRKLQQKYCFPLLFPEIRTAINTKYVLPEVPVCDGDTVVFISPVAGG